MNKRKVGIWRLKIRFPEEHERTLQKYFFVTAVFTKEENIDSWDESGWASQRNLPKSRSHTVNSLRSEQKMNAKLYLSSSLRQLSSLHQTHKMVLKNVIFYCFESISRLTTHYWRYILGMLSAVSHLLRFCQVYCSAFSKPNSWWTPQRITSCHGSKHSHVTTALMQTCWLQIQWSLL